VDTIYSYGGGEVLFKVFNGIAMLFNSGMMTYILKALTALAITWAAIEGIKQNSFKPSMHWLIKYSIITSMLINPTSSVSIYDVVTGSRYKVDNIPIGLSIPSSLFSTLGYGITVTFDQAFSNIESNKQSLDYTKYGSNFGAGLISQVRNFKIQDAVFRENIERFIDDCIQYFYV
jgi:conjugal transfer mating pair stabilization protein TraG